MLKLLQKAAEPINEGLLKKQLSTAKTPKMPNPSEGVFKIQKDHKKAQAEGLYEAQK